MTRRDSRDTGFVTAEAAMVLPSLVLVLLLAVSLLALVGAELKCVDASREAARQAARGETDARAREAGLALAPAGATVVLAHHAGWVEVRVLDRFQPLRVLPALTLRAAARVEEEQR